MVEQGDLALIAHLDDVAPEYAAAAVRCFGSERP